MPKPKGPSKAPEPPPVSTSLSTTMADVQVGRKRKPLAAAKPPPAWRLPVEYEPPVFEPADEAGLLQYLEQNGYVVVQALNAGEVAAAEDQFWNDAATAFGWDRAEPMTWEARTTAQTLANRSDCGHIRGLDHSEFSWMLRKNAAVARVYNAIARHFSGAAEGEQQLASFNSLNVFRPHGLRPEWRTTARPWYHVDNPKPDPRLGLRQPRLVFPGVLNLMPVSADSGGFVAVPRSHTLFGARPDADTPSESDYLDLSPYNNFVHSEPNTRIGNTLHTQPILVCTGGRRGTLTIWDPRLVHCSTSSLTPSDEPNHAARQPRLLRLASFVALCPAAWASSDDLKQRRKLVEDKQCANSHIPYGVFTQRRFECLAFYDGLWTDEVALRLVQGAAPLLELGDASESQAEEEAEEETRAPGDVPSERRVWSERPANVE